MRDLKNNLTTPGKGSTNIQSRRGKSFGYQVLGFGSGGGTPNDIQYLIVAGGGSGAGDNGEPYTWLATDSAEHLF